MASPSARASTAVNWSIQPVSLNAISFPVARLLVQLYFGTERPGPQSAQESCWLDTGAPLSVVPFNIHHRRLVWQPIPGVQTSWAGQVCDLGRIDFWFPINQPPHLRGPMSLLAKFAVVIPRVFGFRSCSDWNSSSPIKPNYNSPSRRMTEASCSLESLIPKQAESIDQKLVSVVSLLTRANPGAHIPAHRAGETMPCSWSHRSAPSRSARVVSSTWTSPRR
jgi:hypothetical protein